MKPSTQSLGTLLIANRGEIACRIIRTARAMGIRSVAIYSEADADARHVHEADLAIPLGGSKPADSYLQIDKVVAAALACGADAVHPGYGFLSENAAFARRLAHEGILFLGPPAEAIEAMGSKSAAKALMEQAGVPLVPGYHDNAQDLQTFVDAAQRIGYPVLLKAAAGGGGKGMKVAESAAELGPALDSARREALAAFGDGHMLVEKYLAAPRHVEIQVFADKHGHCLYLHERDCSIQRRHQKVLEEAPAPGLDASLRRAMGEAAVRAAQAIGYVGAGTVEFLLDGDARFYFMEMNTRLQVEHPVTEAITGLDLVAWQIRVARGEALPLTQEQVPLLGHAIEVRLYAEDPAGGFLPASGQLALYREPAAGPGRRVDSAVREGDTISPFYDPMIAKLIAWGETREEARLRLLAMLGETAVGGIKSNLALLQRILATPAFASGEVDTGFIERHTAALLPTPPTLTQAFWQSAARAYLRSIPNSVCEQDRHSPWSVPTGWRLLAPAQATLDLRCGAHSQLCTVNLATSPADLDEPRLVGRRGDVVYLQWRGDPYEVSQVDALSTGTAGAALEGSLAAPMNGSIVRLLVGPGQVVEQGDGLVVLEAMKMEHTVRANRAGVIRALCCEEGQMVSEGTVLIEMQEADHAA
nr:acetyl/propionyl/methylcrotonyl-CoA carboxylase subunit alpha [uncultured Pseudomonas sp.]